MATPEQLEQAALERQRFLGNPLVRAPRYLHKTVRQLVWLDKQGLSDHLVEAIDKLAESQKQKSQTS